MHDVSCEFRIGEDLKAKSSSDCNSSYPELTAASHKTGISLAILFLNLLLAGAVKTGPPKQPLYIQCLSFTLQGGVLMGRGTECRWGGRHLLSAEQVLIHQCGGNC